MDWTEIKIRVPVAATEQAAAIANMVVGHGIYIEDYSDLEQGAWEIAHIDLIDEELKRRDREHAVIHIYLSKEIPPQESVDYLAERFKAAGIAFSICENDVSEEQWANGWKRFFKPTEIGRRLCVCPSWESYDNTSGRVVLQIDPGAAFGTGTHATTSMCLAALEQMVAPGMTVLDIGSGSGILSVAAVLLGAEEATGVDIDPVAVKVARENAALNGVSEKTRYLVGDLDDCVSGRFDIVVANIVADVIIRLCDSVEGLMKPDGYFLCSGIIDQRAGEVERALAGHGFVTVQKREENGWTAFLVKKSDGVGGHQE